MSSCVNYNVMSILSRVARRAVVVLLHGLVVSVVNDVSKTSRVKGINNKSAIYRHINGTDTIYIRGAEI